MKSSGNTGDPRLVAVLAVALVVLFGLAAWLYLSGRPPGDGSTATYTIAEIDEETLKTYADIEVVNQRGELCTVARNILQFIV
jgi:hypothetical protein